MRVGSLAVDSSVSVRGQVSEGSVRVTGVKNNGDEQQQQLMGAGRGGELAALKGISVSSVTGELIVRLISFEMVASDVSFGKHMLSDVRIERAVISSSDIILGSGSRKSVDGYLVKLF